MYLPPESFGDHLVPSMAISRIDQWMPVLGIGQDNLHVDEAVLHADRQQTKLERKKIAKEPDSWGGNGRG